MSVSKFKQQVLKKRNYARFAAADKNRVASIKQRHTSPRAPGSWLKSLGQQSRSPSPCLIFTRLFLSRDRDRRRNWPRTERSQKVSDAKSKKSVRSVLQNTVGRVNRSRDLFLFGLIKKKGKRAGLPKRVRSPRVLIHMCAGGEWRTQHAYRNCSFFCSGSFFLTQVRQVKVVSAHFAQCSYAPAFKRLASRPAAKLAIQYSAVMGWLRRHVSFSLLHSAVMCLSGSRQHVRGDGHCPVLAIAEGHF